MQTHRELDVVPEPPVEVSGPTDLTKLPGAKKNPLTAGKKLTANGLVDRTGLLGDLKIGRRRNVVCQGMRIGIRLVGEWRRGVNVISSFYKCWASRRSRMNGDMRSICLCVIPSIRRFVNCAIKRLGSRTKAAGA